MFEKQDPSIHTFTLLWLLRKWRQSTSAGGFSNVKHQAMAGALDTMFIKEGLRRDFSCQVELVKEWKLTWPRPTTLPLRNLMALTIKAGGWMEFAPWYGHLEDNAPPDGWPKSEQDMLMNSWLFMMRPWTNESKSVHILNVPFYMDAGGNVWDSLMPQVLWHVAREVECTLGLSMKGTAECMWPLKVGSGGDGNEDATCREVDISCMNHIQQTRTLLTGVLHMGITMDKAQVRGLELSNAFWTLPDNKAGIMVPQVV